ncbi:hypothetical protein DL96DRAFT_1573260 [Flagelloscypha sp. PMI_526]|nr:hypothetical protein DL96DRAFT_1573260 [Flagelloscypha sp. PMI_526]
MAFVRLPRRWIGAVIALAVFLVFCLYSGYGPNTETIRHSVGLRKSSYFDDVPEIYGLLGLVVPSKSSVHQHELLLPSQHSHVLVEGPGKGAKKSNLASGIYDLTSERTSIDWKLRREEIDHDHPVIVFGKSYCPYTKRLLTLLSTLPITPAPHIVQVDLRDDTSLMQDVLLRLTGRRTVPNMVVHGASIGGSDDVHALAAKNGKQYTAEQGGRLREILEEAGVRWGSSSKPGKDNKLPEERPLFAKQD